MMNSTLSRRERKKRETRQRLMETALRLFREHGYDATTVEEITEAADVAKGTFFNYFETKEAVLPALAGLRLQQLEESLLPEHDAPASPVARIKLALRLVAEDPLSDPVLTQRIFAAGMRHQGMHPVHALMKLLSEQVRQAQAAGEIRADLDPLYLGSVIRATFFQQIMLWHCGYRPTPLPELLDETVDLLLDGIAGPKWRK
jgi:AcrR family transcriptional regulator